MDKGVAVIDESACVGCTKCISACPFDAIIGTHQRMHTVIADYCIGCKLCIPPCPVDCITMSTTTNNPTEWHTKALMAKNRFKARKQRLAQQESTAPPLVNNTNHLQSQIQAALARVNAKQEPPTTPLAHVD